ncbi:hypothetical protein [Lacisediminimonas sp.]|uniref:hypothetical protein n=1 Tax=Lacisediminimonas sp. TaxID=3060582 RepID=UPI0027206C8D|nr:hypothetical protein [Lacisediminimonas sp.]MDO8299236.1 hypothetical protein [Lacisediminimonas sp.]
MKKLMALVAVALTVSLPASAFAHGDKPKHGGVVQSASDLSFELVNRDGKAMIYVEDHGNSMPTAGASGKLTVLTGGEKSELALEPSAPNAMSTKENAKLVKGSKAIASISFADKKVVNVRFSIN